MIIQIPSPNFSKGRGAYKPEAIVIHIMEGTLLGTASWFRNPSSQVSTHYGVGKGGEVHQYVKEEDTAWHAGGIQSPAWNQIRLGVNPNAYTIGIEHEGNSKSVWTPEMKNASASLIKDICTRWNIPINRSFIIGHYQITTNKPNCPAVDKSIIDELIALANGLVAKPKPTAISLIEEALTILKNG